VRTVLYAHDYGLFCVRKTNQRGAVETVDADDSGTAAGTSGVSCGAPGLARCSACARHQYGTARGGLLAAGLASMRRAARRAEAVVAVSSSVSRTLAAALDVPTPRVIPPALDLSAPVPPGRPAFLPDGEFVLYVGQLSPHKGVDVLVEAVRRVPGLQLVMLGMPKAGWCAPVDPRVTVRLDVPHAEVMAAWRHATAGVVPSLWADPMPLVALEAMSAGCPLVASAAGGLLDSVDDGVTGRLVPAGDPAALARALVEIVGDPSLRARRGSAARHRAARFGLDAVTDSWAGLYRELAAERPVEVTSWT
jgi:glycosyltransferase involved in cell wall biosynthesis